MLSGSLAFKKTERHEEALKLNKKVGVEPLLVSGQDSRWLSSRKAIRHRDDNVTQYIVTSLIVRNISLEGTTTASIFFGNPRRFNFFYIRCKNCMLN